MAKNDFLAKQRETRQAFFNAGLQCGRQQIIDVFSIVLNDPNIMGKNVFGKTRLLKVLNGVNEYIDVFQKAWEKHDETDYYRAKMDEILEKIYGEDMHYPFNERYEFCPDYDYKKGKWK